MINKINYNLELSTDPSDGRSETTLPTLSILLFEFKEFRKEVFFFQSHYQGADYFNILENISELHSSMDSIIQQLKIHVGDLDKVSYRTLSNSLEYPLKKNKVQINSDTAGIALILLGLKNLIQTNRKAVLEAEDLEDNSIESLLREFEKELERNRWIFYLFSNY